jgi:hypothetical protein
VNENETSIKDKILPLERPEQATIVAGDNGRTALLKLIWVTVRRCLDIREEP